MNFIEPATLALVSRAMDAASLRHRAIATNIANANIPGAQPLQVRFEQALEPVREAFSSHTSIGAQDVPQPQLLRTGGEIQLDTEMAQMASNSLHYQALARALSRHLSILSIAVQEGRR